MKLAELEQGWDAFYRAMDDNAGDLTPELANQLDCLNLAERTKIDGYALAMKGLEGDAGKYRDLANDLLAKARTAEARHDWLKQRVKDYLLLKGATEIKGEVYRFRLQKNGNPPVEILVDPEELPKALVEVKVTPIKALIREAILAGQIEATVARLGEPTYGIRVY